MRFKIKIFIINVYNIRKVGFVSTDFNSVCVVNLDKFLTNTYIINICKIIIKTIKQNIKLV